MPPPRHPNPPPPRVFNRRHYNNPPLYGQSLSPFQAPEWNVRTIFPEDGSGFFDPELVQETFNVRPEAAAPPEDPYTHIVQTEEVIPPVTEDVSHVMAVVQAGLSAWRVTETTRNEETLPEAAQDGFPVVLKMVQSLEEAIPKPKSHWQHILDDDED